MCLCCVDGRHRPVYMYCTGGIRCERASTYLRQELGVQEVYQLRGGIHRYVDKFGTTGLFKGKNFVFDRRLAITSSTSKQGSRQPGKSVSASNIAGQESGCKEATDESASIVGQCRLCQSPWDEYDLRWQCSKCDALVLLCNGCALKRVALTITNQGAQQNKPGNAEKATSTNAMGSAQDAPAPLICSLCVALSSR